MSESKNQRRLNSNQHFRTLLTLKKRDTLTNFPPNVKKPKDKLFKLKNVVVRIILEHRKIRKSHPWIKLIRD